LNEQVEKKEAAQADTQTNKNTNRQTASYAFGSKRLYTYNEMNAG